MTRTRLILAPLALLALLVAGCGGSDTTKTVTVTPTAPAAETVVEEDSGVLSENEWTALNAADDDFHDAVTTFQDSLTDCTADVSTVQACVLRKSRPLSDAADDILDALDDAQDTAADDCADALATAEDDADEFQEASEAIITAVKKARYGNMDVDAWAAAFNDYRDHMDEALETCSPTATSATASTDPDAAIKATVTGFYDALVAEDADAACALLSEDGQAEVIGFAGAGNRADTEDCVSAIDESYLAEGDPAEYAEVGERVAGGDVAVDGDRAEITSKNGLPIQLVNESDQWMIDSLGLDASTQEAQAADLGLDVGAAKVDIAKFCVDAVGYLTGIRDELPSDKRFTKKNQAVEALIRAYREDPNAVLSSGGTIEDEIIDAISVLENGDCDVDSAARLDRTIR